MGNWDWLIIAVFLLFSLGISFYYKSQASKSLGDFFLGGRNLPWYIAGVSMIATTFAADTPLAVTELVAKQGISGNWMWWSFLTGGVLTTFFFARLWRRANVLTEVELIDIRYSGKPARLLRKFKAVYLGLFMNVIIIAWVNLAMASILSGLFNIDETLATFYCGLLMVLVAFYSSLSGLKGIAITDSFQFVIAMISCIILAVIMINSPQIGGIANLKESLPAESLNFFPTIASEGENSSGENALSISTWSFFAFFGVIWWASWYPGAEPGGGGYVAQRMMSAKDEKNALWATLFFQIGHYCIRPWPWILVALCATVIYPLSKNLPNTEIETIYNQLIEKGIEEKVFVLDDEKWAEYNANITTDISKENSTIFIENKTEIEQLRTELSSHSKEDDKLKKSMVYTQDHRYGFIYAILDFLPKNGLLGLLLVAFLAAYMSTISTQLNWGASYLVNDFYLPMKEGKEDESNENLIKYSRIATILLMFIGFGTTFMLDSISKTWEIILESGAGLGLVLILRWYWWRINAWAEISATIAPFVAYFISHQILDLESPFTLFFSVAFTTLAWVTVMFLTQPTDISKLEAFYKRVQPQGVWEKVRKPLGYANNNGGMIYLFGSWVGATVFIYSILFTTGKLIFMEYQEMFIWMLCALLGFVLLYFTMKKSLKEN